MRPVFVALAVAALVSACAASSSESKAPATQAHPSDWYTIGAGRADYQKTLQEFDRVSANCDLACKALASLTRAADHLCAVAEPEECSDARVRVDRARRAVEAQCGGC